MASEVLSLWPKPEVAGGREIELSALERELDEAKAGSRPRFVFVSGPAGVGKSHLFRSFRARLGARAVEVFEAESARDGRRPFGPFASLVPALLESLSHSGTGDAQLSSLSRRVAPLTRSAQVEEGQRLELFDAVSELFVLAGRGQPVFLFPDLEAADKSSLELFRYLAAVVTSPESRAAGLFVVSFRDESPLPPPLQEVLGKVSARTLSLGTLDLEGIRGFLSRAEVAQRLFEVTGGMPDALEELLTRPSPRPVELFVRRVEKLSAPVREVMTLLAVSPTALSVTEVASALRRLKGTDGDAALELDGLVRQHLATVKVRSGEPAYRFTREREQEAFLSAVEPSALRAARLALGEAFAEAGELATASSLLLEIDPRRGAELALRAAEALASRGANEEAAELFERALPLIGPVDFARASRRLGELAQARADFRGALRHFSRARVRGERSARVPVLVPMARVLVQLGRLSWAERLLESALREGEPSVQARARVEQVELALLRGRPELAVSLGAEAVVAVADQGETLVRLRNAIGRAHLLRGELERADELFARNAELAQTQGLNQELARALVNRGVVAHKQGDRERAIRFYQAAAPEGERAVEARALANLGSLYADSGDFELALEHLSRALQAFSRLSSAREVAHAASNLARLQAFLGDLPRAIELSEHALRRATEIGERYLQASALLNLGEAQLDKREPEEAVRLFDEARALYEASGNDGYAALAAAEKARAHLLLGDRAQAQAELSRKVLEKAGELPAAQIEAELVRGDLALALGDLHAAGRSTTRAREALLQKPDLEGPYRVYFLMGRLRLAAGDTSGAQAEMARAGRLLDELTQRVPAARRHAFLSIPRRAEVLGAIEPELRLPRLASPVLPRAPAAGIGLVGRSESLARITRQIEPIARSNTTVLIRGESGTGKELLAQAIHDLSPRKAMPIVKVNCAAMVEDLLLSELFGHEKGAFTGAVRERKGRFELADGGTLFLDEIGDITPKAQVALLRVLQEREFERVGGTRTLKVDVRVICATNRDLESLIAQGRFRQDLYYRLKGVMLELPALRERLEDLGPLCAHFLGRIARERNEPARQLSGEALELLGRHTWPGNVRELENVLASAAIFAEGAVITPDCFAHVAELAALMNGGRSEKPAPAPAAAPTLAQGLPPVEDSEDEEGDEPSGGSSPARVDDVDFYDLVRTRDLSLKELRRQLEIQCIRRALLDAKGNISEAARLLKMKRSRLSQIVNAEPELKGVCHGN